MLLCIHITEYWLLFTIKKKLLTLCKMSLNYTRNSLNYEEKLNSCNLYTLISMKPRTLKPFSETPKENGKQHGWISSKSDQEFKYSAQGSLADRQKIFVRVLRKPSFHSSFILCIPEKRLATYLGRRINNRKQHWSFLWATSRRFGCCVDTSSDQWTIAGAAWSVLQRPQRWWIDLIHCFD